MNKGIDYSLFYEILLNLRECYHSYGRIDDSNAKLDEITKLIALSYSLACKGERFGIGCVKSASVKYTNNEKNIALGLRRLFEEEVQSPIFLNSDGTNIFGAEPSLNIQPTENLFAERLISEIQKIDFIELVKKESYSNFDIINECFGHFVRENFRNNKEDAQYMTPLEIVGSMLDILFNDLEKQGLLSLENLRNFIVMDPTCGVGTLLVESSNKLTKYICQKYPDKAEELISNFRKKGMVGQDKIDRMVRMSKVNTLLLGGNPSNINVGNSIIGESSIDSYIGKVNVIFTNPPFGAEFNVENLDLTKFPLLKQLNLGKASVPSELLMLDRCINLLDNNGSLLIVLPDSVFSSKGLDAQYREALLKNVTIKGVVELPAVTFAQAGTRTNTCILYLQKRNSHESDKVFMSICDDIGFTVKDKAGVPVKFCSGENKMPYISNIINNTNNVAETIISLSPSITRIDLSKLVANYILKPSFYSAQRFSAIDALLENSSSEFIIKKLGDVADFKTKGRKSYYINDNIKHISVLHINPNCTIDMREVNKFCPISKGRECFAGELIYSKINPRIPRMAVIPEVDYNLVCSNEFEIIVPNDEIDAYTLCILLRTNKVRIQIENLTSGTSSSHNRIKSEELLNILIPVPVSEHAKKTLKDIGEKVKNSMLSIYSAEEELYSQMDALEHMMN